MDFNNELNIGKIHAKNRIWLAPMAEITDKFFRKKAVEYGAGFTFSGMVSVKGLINNYKSTMKKVGNHYDNENFSFQLFGSDPKDFYQAVKLLIEKDSIHIFDINAGCPVKKVVKTSSGSALILYPQRVYDIVKILKDNFDITLSIKTRKGWNDKTTSEQLIEYSIKAGIDFITIHPRTREQMYSGNADIEYCKYIRSKYDIPMIVSGDIKSIKDLDERKEFDGVMIGREAFKDLSIFSELQGRRMEIDYKKLFLEHIQFYEKHYKRIGGFKKFLPMYIQHTQISKTDRNKIYQLKEYEEIKQFMLDSFPK